MPDVKRSTGPVEPVIVVGMHRSGTGMVAEMLSALGVNMGRRIEANDESTFFLRVNEWILYQGGSSWFTPDAFDYSMSSESFRTMVSSCVDQWVRSTWSSEHFGIHRDHSKAWGFKDPRTTITFPIWHMLYPDAKVISIRRNGADVARSLSTRVASIRARRATWSPTIPLGHRFPKANIRNAIAGANFDSALNLWATYCEHEDRILGLGCPSLSLRYEDVGSDPKHAVEAMVEFLDLAPSASEWDSALSAVRVPPCEKHEYALDEADRMTLRTHGYPS